MTQQPTCGSVAPGPTPGKVLRLGCWLALLVGGPSGCQNEYFIIREPVFNAAQQRAMMPTTRDLGVPGHRLEQQELQVPVAALKVRPEVMFAQEVVAVQGSPEGPLAGQLLLADPTDLRPGRAVSALVPVRQVRERAGVPVPLRLRALDLAGAGPAVRGQVLVRARANNGWLAGGIALTLVGLPWLVSGVAVEASQALIDTRPDAYGISRGGAFVEFYTAPAMVLGTLHLVAGVTLIAIGARRHAHPAEAATSSAELLQIDVAAGTGSAAVGTPGFDPAAAPPSP